MHSVQHDLDHTSLKSYHIFHDNHYQFSTEEEFSKYLFVPEDIDLMIRTSGELRISNYLLWQLAYAELIFTPVAWPDFDEKALKDCLDEFASRDRRFGGLTS